MVHSKWKYDYDQELCEIQFSIFLLKCGLKTAFNQSSYRTRQRWGLRAFFSLPSGNKAQPRNLPGKAVLSSLFHFCPADAWSARLDANSFLANLYEAPCIL